MESADGMPPHPRGDFNSTFTLGRGRLLERIAALPPARLVKVEAYRFTAGC